MSQGKTKQNKTKKARLRNAKAAGVAVGSVRDCRGCIPADKPALQLHSQTRQSHNTTDLASGATGGRGREGEEEKGGRKVMRVGREGMYEVTDPKASFKRHR